MGELSSPSLGDGKGSAGSLSALNSMNTNLVEYSSRNILKGRDPVLSH